MQSPLKPFGENLWLLDGDPVRMYTIPFETRMTVARMASGEIWLHSPVQPTPERVAAVDRLGAVAHIVAPTTLHNLYVSPWQKAFPRAKSWAAPGIQERCPHLTFDAELTQVVPEALAPDFDMVLFSGSEVLKEAVFYHRASQSLIVTDIIQNHRPEAHGWFWRAVKSWIGVLAPKGGVPKDYWISVQDRDAAQREAEAILAWDIQRVVVSHGVCIEEDAANFVRQAFRRVTLDV